MSGLTGCKVNVEEAGALFHRLLIKVALSNPGKFFGRD